MGERIAGRREDHVISKERTAISGTPFDKRMHQPEHLEAC